MKSLPSDPALTEQLLRGAARLQARQDMLECFVRALIIESPPAHPLFARALRTAKSDLERRWAEARADTPPQIEADALALWNVLWNACAPPGAADRSQPPRSAS
jgi:hypothetical protein